MNRLAWILTFASLLALAPGQARSEDPPSAPQNADAAAEAMKRRRIALDNRKRDLGLPATKSMRLLDEFRAKDFRVWSTTRDRVVAEGGNAVPALLIALDETDWEVRALAAACLAEIKDGSTAGALAAAYDKEETYVEARRRHLLAMVAILAPESKETILKAASDKDVGIRAAAARGLAAYEDPRMRTALIRLAVDADVDVKYEALGGLAALRDPAAVGMLVDAAKSLVEDEEDARVASRYAEDHGDRYAQYLLGLTLARARDDKAVDALLGEILNAAKPWDRKSFLRIGVAEGVGRASSGRGRIDPRIALGLTAKLNEVREACSFAAGWVGKPELLPHLTTALSDAQMQVRSNAVRAIGRIGGEAAVKLLEKALADAAGEVRIGAVHALADIRLPESTRLLVATLKDDKSAPRVVAVRALAQRTTESGVLDGLVTATKDADWGVREQALVALAHHPAPAVVLPAIVEALDDPDYGVRTNACLALAAIAPSARDAASAVGQKVASMYLGAREGRLVRGADEALDAVRFPSAAPTLIKGLDSDALETRRRANLALMKMTETSKNFDPSAPKAQRDEAAKRWRDWWAKQDDKLPARGARAHAAVTGSLAEVAKDLKWKGLDLALLFDSTATMGGMIHEAKERVEQIAAEVHDLIPSLRVSVYTYRDFRCEYLYFGSPLTYDTWKLRSFLQEARAGEGGDPPEAINECVAAACDRLDWRPGAHKVVVYVGDAMNHPETDDKFLAKIKEFFTVKNEAVLHAVYTGQGRRALDVKGRTMRDELVRLTDKVFDSFRKSAEAGRGRAVLLDDPGALIKELLVLTFGEAFRPDVENLLDFER